MLAKLCICHEAGTTCNETRLETIRGGPKMA
jgi:hypothetical protein